jgi:hypothetical protein
MRWSDLIFLVMPVRAQADLAIRRPGRHRPGVPGLWRLQLRFHTPKKDGGERKKMAERAQSPQSVALVPQGGVLSQVVQAGRRLCSAVCPHVVAPRPAWTLAVSAAQGQVRLAVAAPPCGGGGLKAPTPTWWCSRTSHFFAKVGAARPRWSPLVQARPRPKPGRRGAFKRLAFPCPAPGAGGAAATRPSACHGLARAVRAAQPNWRENASPFWGWRSPASETIDMNEISPQLETLDALVRRRAAGRSVTFLATDLIRGRPLRLWGALAETAASGVFLRLASGHALAAELLGGARPWPSRPSGRWPGGRGRST